MTVIDESLTAKGFTPRASVPLVYGRQRTIEAITIHWWGLYGQTHTGVNNFFVYGAGQTSAHFVVSGVPYPRINCLVNPWDAAWHAGNPIGNASSVGIECRPEATEADYKVVAELVRFLRDTYGANLPLIPHRDWQATQCPGNYDLGKIHRMAEALKVNPTPVPVQPKPPVGDIVDISHELTVIQQKVLLEANKPVILWRPGEAGVRSAGPWNLATEGLAYYDADVFIHGSGLVDGESLKVLAQIVTSGGRNGYYTQEIHGSSDGEFQGAIRLKSPLLSTGKLEIQVTPTSDCSLNVYGAQVFAFKK